MLAWMGGKRRLVKEQRARRKLQGVFDKVATKFKPAGVTAAKQPRPAATREVVDAVAERLSRLPLSSKQPTVPLSLDVAAILGPSAPLQLVARPLQAQVQEEQGQQARPAAGSGTRAQHPGTEDQSSYRTPTSAAPASKTKPAPKIPSAAAAPTSH